MSVWNINDNRNEIATPVTPYVGPINKIPPINVAADMPLLTKTILLFCRLSNFDKYIYSHEPMGVLNLTNSDKFLNYAELKEVDAFCGKLKNHVSSTITIRSHPSKLRAHSLVKFEKKFKRKYKFDKNFMISGEQFMRKYKLNIFHEPYSTSFAFSLALDIPSIVISPHNTNYYNSDAKKIFNSMIKANIFHKNHKSAVKFVDENHDNLLKWWNSKKTIKARKDFSKMYGNYSLKPKYKNLVYILINEKNKLQD